MLKIFRHLFPLFIVQFFTWLGLFALWIYSTPVITRYIFHTSDSESADFEKGTTWVGICFAFYATLGALLVFMIPVLSKKISIGKLHAYALLAGAIGLSMIYFIQNKYLLFFSFAFIGIAWSSIGNIPYELIGHIAPEEKMTTYFAVFNFSVVIPQVTAAFLLSYANRVLFKNETIDIMLLGGGSMLIASVCMFFVDLDKELTP
ncbi:MAG: MFS transporter [Bacteroidetes bacterium]|nr:MFS transporter [Bacteroidota bacterium]